MSGPVNDPPPDGAGRRPLLAAVTLPCGADVDLLLEQVADGRGADRDAHQQQCVHCQAALSEFTALWAPVAELAAAPVPAPARPGRGGDEPDPLLVRDIWYTLEITEIGAIRIAARIVAALARDCARMVPGVRVAFGRSTQARSPRSPRRPPSGTVTRTPPSGSWAAPRSWTWPLRSATATRPIRSLAISSGRSSPPCATRSGCRVSRSTSPSMTSWTTTRANETLRIGLRERTKRTRGGLGP